MQLFANNRQSCCQFFIHLPLNQILPLALTLENSQNIACYCSSDHRACFSIFFSLLFLKKFLWLNCVLQSTRGKGIFIRIRTWEHTKAAIVGSLMGMLSTSRQSRLLSWVFTTLSQPAGIWRLRGISILLFYLFFWSLPGCTGFHLSVLLTERPAVCGGRNRIKAND